MNFIELYIRKLLGLCQHDYKYHKVRAIHNDWINQDYTIEFEQCEKCGHIHFITMHDNLKHSTCN